MPLDRRPLRESFAAQRSVLDRRASLPLARRAYRGKFGQSTGKQSHQRRWLAKHPRATLDRGSEEEDWAHPSEWKAVRVLLFTTLRSWVLAAEEAKVASAVRDAEEAEAGFPSPSVVEGPRPKAAAPAGASPVRQLWADIADGDCEQDVHPKSCIGPHAVDDRRTHKPWEVSGNCDEASSAPVSARSAGRSGDVEAGTVSSKLAGEQEDVKLSSTVEQPTVSNGFQRRADATDCRIQLHSLLEPSVGGLWLGLDLKNHVAMDQEIVGTMAASPDVHRGLVNAARAATRALSAVGIVPEQVVLYGSLSLGRTGPLGVEAGETGEVTGPVAAVAQTATPGCFITDLSDVDCAVLEPGQGCNALELIKRFQDACKDQVEWSQVQATVVPRFSVTQWAMLSNRGVHLDLTSFSDNSQFEQFRARQRSFREAFWSTRSAMRGKHGDAGAQAFDAYIFLVKAFAAFSLRSTLTSFQAISVGLYSLQRRLASVTATKTPSGLTLLRRFLLFCRDFFALEGTDGQPHHTFRTAAIDICGNGRLIERRSSRAPAELYFTDAERSSRVSPDAWMNVLHNIDPGATSKKAQGAFERWFFQNNPRKAWARIRKDLLPVMKPNLCAQD